MKVGVTGGNGFIGSWVIDELIASGHSALVFDTRGRKPREDCEVMLGSVCDEVAVTEMAAHVDGIIHLAAVLGTQETVKNPRPAFKTNGLGGMNVLEAAAQYDLPFVNICVGNYWMNNSYSITKNAFERAVMMFKKENGTRAANVRCVNAYGPRQAAAPPFAPGKVRKIMPAFICRALSGMPIEVYGDGEQVSDMVWVGDVATALRCALEGLSEGLTLDRVIECGPIFSSTVNEVATLVRMMAAGVTGEEVDIVHLPMRPGENVGDKVTCNGYTLQDVGIDVQTMKKLPAGVAETVQFFADNMGVTWDSPVR